jgi:hypothetical protein
LVSADWLQQHIQSKGPLGAAYPTPPFIMEGDTPSWLWLIPNGLASAWNPSWGGWGGRYVYRQPTGGLTDETHPIFTNRSCATADDPACTQDGRSADTVVGYDGEMHTDDFATIYRWRQAYQEDFANRMDWTVESPKQANHAPVALVDGKKGTAPLCVAVRPNTPVILDARGSSDPDGNTLSFSWFDYKEAGRTLEPSSPDVKLSATTGKITATPLARGQAHIILTVTDDGKRPGADIFPARSYRRVVLNVTKNAPSTPSPGSCGTKRAR